MKIKNMVVGAMASAAMIGIAIAPALAASIAGNGSFESGTAPGVFLTVNPGGTAIDDWSVDAGNIDYIGSYWLASDGDRSIDMSGNTAGTISQEITTLPGAQYMVSFDLSGNPAGGPSVKSLNVDTGEAPINFTYDTSVAGTTLADMKWETKSVTFTAIGALTTLTFTSLTDGFFGPALDNVSVEQVLPLTEDECKKDGWQSFGVFKNQGDCVSFVATGGTNSPAQE